MHIYIVDAAHIKDAYTIPRLQKIVKVFVHTEKTPACA